MRSDLLMPIYTKGGDGGVTGLPTGKRLSKADGLFETLGSLDQTNAAIGLAVSHLGKQAEIIKQLVGVQAALFNVGAFLADPSHQKKQLAPLTDLTIKMEELIDRWEKETGPIAHFLIPGGAPASASLQLARAISRSSERNYHRLADDNRSPEISQFLNRLSDFLFQAARVVNFRLDLSEDQWPLGTK